MAGKKKSAPKKSAIEVIEEDTGKKKAAPGTECPVCGAPGGRLKCDECGWSIEELGPDYDIRSGDPVTTLRRAERTFKSVKDELKALRAEKEALLTNNRKFSELVESMEMQLKTMRADAGKRYVYSYNAGGWGEIGDIDRTKLLMKKKAVSVADINRQLTEIMKLLKRYKH
jgi:hypothetical protein